MDNSRLDDKMDVCPETTEPHVEKEIKRENPTSELSETAVAIHIKNGNEIFSSNPKNDDASDIKTLEESLDVFELSSHLQKLENSLEAVRRHKKTKEDHELELKLFDKEMIQLSTKYHPDKIRQRGESEVLNLQKFQTALNATRKAFNILTKLFLEDIDIDYKYAFFTKLNISLLGNEDKVEDHVYEVLFKITLISEIKRHIISEIRKFLEVSQYCVKSYYSESDYSDFVKYRNLALLHLKTCVRGYKKLHKEYKAVEEDCKFENLVNISSLICGEIAECSGKLKYLERLLQAFLQGKFLNPTTHGPFDDYFVLPFVYYMNIIQMCDIMKNNARQENVYSIRGLVYSIRDSMNYPFLPSVVKNFLKAPASYLENFYGEIKNCEKKEISEDDSCEKISEDDSCEEISEDDSCEEISEDDSCEEISEQHDTTKVENKNEFLQVLKKISEELETQYKTDHYTENSTKTHMTEELKECLKMQAEFEQKREELLKTIREIKENNEKIKNRYDKVMKDSEELSKKTQERFKEIAQRRERYPEQILK